MTKEELNTELYRKIEKEFNELKGWLLTQSQEVVLNHAYEYNIKNDILLHLEYNDLSEEQCAALLLSNSPLEDIYHDFERIESDHMELIADCVETRANYMIEREKEIYQVPVYYESAAYAKQNNEMDLLRISDKANLQCKTDIENAISTHYRNNRLDDTAAKSIIKKYGAERTNVILAATIKQKDWDERISPDNKRWANEIPTPDRGTQSVYFTLTSTHPGLINIFTNQVKKELERQAERKPSILKKIKDTQKINAPNFSAHLFSQENIL